MWPSTRRVPLPAEQRRTRRLHLLVAGLGGLGLAAIAAAVADLTGLVGPAVPAPPWWQLAGYAVVMGLGYRLRVPVRIRATRYGGTWGDAVVLVGLATLPAPWVVLTSAAVVLAVRLRHPGEVPQLVVAVARNALSAMVGALLLTGLGPGPAPLSPAQLAWLVATFLAMTVTGKAVVVPVVSLDSRTRLREGVLADWDIELLAMAVRLAVGLLAVVVIDQSPQLAYAVPPLVLAGHLGHERWLRGREERRAWRQFHAVTGSLAGLELTPLLRRAVTAGVRLFSADVLEVELRQGTPRLVRGGPEGLRFDGDPADAPPEPERRFPHEVALHGPPGQPAVGAVRLRFQRPIRLDGRDHAMLAGYARALETALRAAAGVVRPTVG